jgi:hypothetical protein
MLDVMIKGFQSIEEVSFSIDGFAALVGRSNIGKSAVVRAIEAALTNALGTDFVRHGEYCSRRIRGTKKCRCQASVHLKTEGFDLLWEKGDEINQYTYNGQVYSRVDRGIPEFLSQDFSLVKIGDLKQLVQVADQAHPIFLLNQPGTVVADVLSDVAKLDEISMAMSDAEKDRKESVSVLKVREKDILDLRLALQVFEGLDDPVQRVTATRQAFGAIEEAVRHKTQLDEFHVKLQELGTGIRGLQPMESIEIPDVEPVGASEKGFSVLLRYEADLDTKTQEVASMEPLEGFYDPDEADLEHTWGVLEQFHSWLDKAAELRGALTQLKEVEASKDISDPPEGAEDLLRLEVFDGQFKGLSREVESLEDVEMMFDPEEPVQNVSDLLSIAEFSERHDSLTASIGTLETTVSELEVQEQALIEEWKALGVCPTCSHPITEMDHLHFDA